MMRAVLGAGFGDEGKGHVVDYLCSLSEGSEPPVVVRFSGGPQAHHQVVMEDGRSHVFASFGSGTLRGASTYWSEYCPVNPYALMKERKILQEKGITPSMWINPECPITTPYEIANNLTVDVDRYKRHGTCGMGIFSTVRREQANVSLLFEDLFYPWVFRTRMERIEKYYGYQLSLRHELNAFHEACEDLIKAAGIYCRDYTSTLEYERNVIFEGSQGLLLDQNYGFFPHVTPSNTGMTNILEMGYKPEVWLVTRAYQTRHGNGPMSEIVPHNIQENPHEKNDDSGWQGEFRRTLLDLDMLQYAVAKDPYIRKSRIVLVVTCLDLMKDEYRLVSGGNIVDCKDEDGLVLRIADALDVAQVYVSRSPTAEGIEEWR